MALLRRLGDRFWVLPAALCVLAAILAEVLVALDDGRGADALPGWVDLVVYRVGESGSRDLLGSIASSTLAVAGTTFSITIAVLALTSSTYGPRLVRNFMADRGNQVVLGVHVATFLYCLLVLRSIRVVGDPGSDPFVPYLAVNVAVLLAVVDVAVLVYFIHHISDSIQVATLTRVVRSELFSTIDLLYPEETGERARRPDVAGVGTEVTSSEVGYLQLVDEGGLVDLASRHDVLVVVGAATGSYLVEGDVLARVHPAQGCTEEVAAAVRDAFEVTDARTPWQDVDFAVQQLTEMAVRALSPGTNDPYTAVNALDDLSAGLVRMVSRPTPDPVLTGDDGAPRVVTVRSDVVELVRTVLDAMRWYAPSSPLVMHHCLEVVARLGCRTPHERVRQALLQEVTLLRAAFAAADHHGHDVAAYDARADRVVLAVSRAAAPGPGNVGDRPAPG